LEIKNKYLSNTLLEKENLINLIKSEKSSLKLQLDDKILKIKDLELLQRLTVNNNNSFDDKFVIDVHDDLPISFHSQPFFHNLSKSGFFFSNLASSINALDYFGLSFGKYFRKIPVLRLFFVFYILFLHFWVLFILYSFF
jgi:hypothetical protein